MLSYKNVFAARAILTRGVPMEADAGDSSTEETGIFSAVDGLDLTCFLTCEAQRPDARLPALVDDPSNRPVYVHRKGGRRRTGVRPPIYDISDEGWAPFDKYGEMKQSKFWSDFLHPEFKAFVLGFTAQAMKPTA